MRDEPPVRAAQQLQPPPELKSAQNPQHFKAQKEPMDLQQRLKEDDKRTLDIPLNEPEEVESDSQVGVIESEEGSGEEDSENEFYDEAEEDEQDDE